MSRLSLSSAISPFPLAPTYPASSGLASAARPLIERLLRLSRVLLSREYNMPVFPLTKGFFPLGAVVGRSEANERWESFGKQPGMERFGGRGGTGGIPLESGLGDERDCSSCGLLPESAVADALGVSTPSSLNTACPLVDCRLSEVPSSSMSDTEKFPLIMLSPLEEPVLPFESSRRPRSGLRRRPLPSLTESTRLNSLTRTGEPLLELAAGVPANSEALSRPGCAGEAPAAMAAASPWCAHIGEFAMEGELFPLTWTWLRMAMFPALEPLREIAFALSCSAAAKQASRDQDDSICSLTVDGSEDWVVGEDID